MKRKYSQGLTPCEGDCGRTLRSSRSTLAQHPGTVKRHSNGMCEACVKLFNLTPESQARRGVLPCKNCQHPTRDQKTPIAEAPGTRRRVGDLCRSCDAKCADVPEEQATAATRALDAFLQARRRRGIPAEGLTVQEDMELAS